MKVIVPLNITALRVNKNDVSSVVSGFKGATVGFDQLPYNINNDKSSTGDTIWRPLEDQNTPKSILKAGIHLHWELPDYFKKGIQSSQLGDIIFPQAPNRWLVTRYLCMYDKLTKKWLQATSHNWVVESDYISENVGVESLNQTSVPLPLKKVVNEQPYRYMGRVVNINEKFPKKSDGNYLNDFTDKDGRPLYLDAIGFSGPMFSSYYPDCCSVFGFHDNFKDNSTIRTAIDALDPIQFKVSYHVIGWIEGDDPCDNLESEVSKLYEEYVQNCNKLKLKIAKTPIDFFSDYMQEKTGWLFNTNSMKFSLNEQNHLKSIDIPDKTICNGIIQEIVWDMESDPINRSFLGKGATLIDDSIRISVGNTSTEALAALLKYDKPRNAPQGSEYLLNLFQSGRIDDIEKKSNLLSMLKNGLHSDGFASKQGGFMWIIRKKQQMENDSAPVDDKELPPELYLLIEKLNLAQREYDMYREALEVERKQFFMDWFRYIKKYSNLEYNFPVEIYKINKFIDESFKNLNYKSEEEIGLLTYSGSAENGVIHAVSKPKSSDQSKAYEVWRNYVACKNGLQEYKEWELLAIPSPAYQMPTDPVLAIEMDSIKCKSRNGDMNYLPVRIDKEIIDSIIIEYKTQSEIIKAKALPDFPTEKFEYSKEILQLVGEASLIIPSLAIVNVSSCLEESGIIFDKESFQNAFSSLLGGGSSIDAMEMNLGVFNVIRQRDYLKNPPLNTKQTSPIDLNLMATFTNSNNIGYLMHPIGWNTQELVPKFEKRYDPFLPLSIIWKVKLNPISRDAGNEQYSEKNITGFFDLNTDLMDYTYSIGNPITDIGQTEYTGSSILMKNTIKNITSPLEKYASSSTNNENETESLINEFENRKIISFSLSGFTSKNLLRKYIPSIPIMNLTNKYDKLTQSISKKLTDSADMSDNWYNYAFNTESPIGFSGSEHYNFYPLRGGFLSVESIEMVDVFGQRMEITTHDKNSDGSLQLTPSVFLSPLSVDVQQKNKAYLPPRLFAPTRLKLNWIDPYPQPVCGWIMPNHLENTLFFYDNNGNAIGSFGIENGILKYRTRAGNKANPSDSLENDIGTIEQSLINMWLAHFMRYIKDNDIVAFKGLMQTILDSDNFISPEKRQGDGSLAILTGRPLAIARIELGIESYGATLPINQLSSSKISPWPQDIINVRYNYSDRMKFGNAGIDTIRFPVWLGDHYNMDDGVIAYLPENKDGSKPYNAGMTFPQTRAMKSILHASDTDVFLKLNDTPQTFTLLIDPCSSIHVLSGLLPIGTLELPTEGFIRAMKNLKITFSTHPTLQQNKKFVIPLFEQKGYEWSWVTMHQDDEISLSISDSSENISWGYSPQTLEEGWLKLSKEKDKDIET